MHSFIVLALASSVFAAPVANNAVNAPVNAVAPGNFAVVGAGVNALVPVKVDAANVNANYDNIADGVVSGNKVHSRNLVNAPVHGVAPVNAVVGAGLNAVAPIRVAAANVNANYDNIADEVGSDNDITLREVKAPVNLVAPVDAVVGAAANVVAPIDVAAANVNANYDNILDDVASHNTITLRGVNAPVNLVAPVDALAGVAANVIAPIDVAAANVNANYDNILDDVASHNTITLRGVNAPVSAIAPVDALAGVAANVIAPIDVAAANVNANYDNILDDVASNNNIALRNVKAPVSAIAPVDALIGVAANAVTPITAKVANVNANYDNIGDDVASGNSINL
ncbi:hypothetical protein K439DRAFT_1630686 [Ramaria rubella]|nr:hypothetical protein K439DRAFT_1643203 [Ramaria rubella]KAF8587386.1 hypothetical protein K439DRAFT_1630686 [Ramaria rubella]